MTFLKAIYIDNEPESFYVYLTPSLKIKKVKHIRPVLYPQQQINDLCIKFELFNMLWAEFEFL